MYIYVHILPLHATNSVTLPYIHIHKWYSMCYPQSAFISCVISFGLLASLSPLYQAVSWFPRQCDVAPSDRGMDQARQRPQQQPRRHRGFSAESHVHSTGIRRPQRSVISDAIQTYRMSLTDTEKENCQYISVAFSVVEKTFANLDLNFD